MIRARLILESESCFENGLFGAAQATAGEAVFNTGMVLRRPLYRVGGWHGHNALCLKYGLRDRHDI